MVNWLDVLISVGINGILLAVLGSYLDSRNATHLAQLNSQLSKLEIDYTTRLTELHKRRADAISQLYKLLARAERILNYVGILVPVIKGQESDVWERRAPARNAVAEMVEYYEDNRVLFTPLQVELMESITDVFSTLRVRAGLRDLARQVWDDEAQKQWTDAFKEAKSVFETTYPDLREQLEIDFREILGVEEKVPQIAGGR